jgi:glycosyltransferase involved in cell wall biosynthesis
VRAANKRVLVVAFDFPPRRTSGVYRPTAMTKYLVRLGWHPTVLTVRARRGDAEDPTLLRKVPPQVQVARTRSLAISALENRLADALRSPGPPNSNTADTPPPLIYRALRRVARAIRPYLYFPDDAIGWVPFAVAEAIRLHRKEHFEAIYTTAPPRSVPLVGLLCKLLLGIPWVCDFRDPWLLADPTRRNVFGESVPLLRRKLENWVEALLVRQAEAIVTVTRGHADELASKYPKLADKLFVVTNGFDEDDFRSLPSRAGNFFPSGQMHLCHCGNVYPRFSGCFFPALAELIRECPELKDRLRVHIMGDPDDKEVAQYAKQPELEQVVQIHRLIPQAEALQAMRSSNSLLLFWGDPYMSRVCVPGKTYEYLRTGRPIFAVTYPGGTEKLIEEAQAGWVVPPDDAEAIKQGLRMLIRETSDGRPAELPRPEFVARFQYDRLASELAKVLSRVVASHGR